MKLSVQIYSAARARVRVCVCVCNVCVHYCVYQMFVFMCTSLSQL